MTVIDAARGRAPHDRVDAFCGMMTGVKLPSTVVRDDLPWFVLVYAVLWWFVTIYCCSWSLVVVCGVAMCTRRARRARRAHAA